MLFTFQRKLKTMSKLSRLQVLVGVLLGMAIVTLTMDSYFDDLMFFLYRQDLQPRPYIERSISEDSDLRCKPPSVDPFDPFFTRVMVNKTLKCPQDRPMTHVDENGILKRSDWTQLSGENVHDPIQCSYAFVHRAGSDDKVSYSGVQVIPDDGVQLTDDNYVVKTFCTQNSVQLYENIHIYIPKFDHVPSNEDKPQVFILTIESLSRLSFIRFMPETQRALEQIGNFHSFSYVNRVEENSFPNSMALITGIAVNDYVASKLANVPWDNRLPYVWDNFKQAGYITSFLEDQPMIGLFSYYNRGFINPPTDFYPVHYWSHMYPNGAKGVWTLLTDMKTYCYGKNGVKLELFLDMAAAFVKTLESKPFFMYSFFSQYTHEDFNNFQIVDKRLAEFLINLAPTFTKNTIFMLLGDHGPRQNGVIDSPVGRMEGSLPFFTIRIPDKLDDRFPSLRKYLSLNEDRLTTWYDIHSMLLDIVHEQFLPVGPRVNTSAELSPFREEIPINRQCATANIPPIYCTCNGRVGISPSFASHWWKGAKEAVTWLESILRSHGLCHTHLVYGELLEGWYIMPDKPGETLSTHEKIDIKMRVKPSHAIVKTYIHRNRASAKHSWGNWTMGDSSSWTPDKLSNISEILCTRAKKDQESIEI
ncbi:uncharacterized protein LOC141855503 [Brevipalpus obovatus]|uniref:uncharacterized protein LOC141855503 n=1 Tax=Brevipalpus obovatus TaxID=246614 RepID=UPI003D9E6F13